jgi:hypothetical protein
MAVELKARLPDRYVRWPCRRPFLCAALPCWHESVDRPHNVSVARKCSRDCLVSRSQRASHPAGRDIAKHLTLEANENNPVPGWVSFVPFHFVIRYRNLRPVRNISLPIRNDGNVVISLDLKDISFVSIRLTTTGGRRVIGLSHPLKPAPHLRGRPFPLAVVSSDGVGGSVPCDDERKSRNDAPYRSSDPHGFLQRGHGTW